MAGATGGRESDKLRTNNVADRAKMDLVRIAAEFGMTPSSRSRVHVNLTDENDPAEE